MGGNNTENSDKLQRLESSFGTSSSSFSAQQHPSRMNQLDIPQSQFRAHVRQFSPNFGTENSGKRVGIPPSHPQIPPISPYSQIPVNQPGNQQMGLQNYNTNSRPSHTRSLSQPSFFALDSLSPLVPSPYQESPSTSNSNQVSADVSMDDRDGSSHSLLPPSSFTRGGSQGVGDSLPPRKAHRRSNSGIPFGFSTIMQSSPPLIPLKSSDMSRPVELVEKEFNNAEGIVQRRSEGEGIDDLFSTYMNLDNIDAFNSSGTDKKPGNENREDLDSRASGTKTNGGDISDNEATSSVNESGNSMKREGIKRNAVGDIAPTTRHYRSVSVDSFIGTGPAQLSPTNSIDENSNVFSLEFGNGEFSGAELNKIMSNEKLAEIALSDPKKAKRILANRQSAARSKERKLRYISELEHKVRILQTQATTLSAQLTVLQHDSAGLTSQNNELKFRLQAMEQQGQLRDALNEALTAEVQRLKLETAELSGDFSKFQQLSINPQMFQLCQQQQRDGNKTTKQEK